MMSGEDGDTVASTRTHGVMTPTHKGSRQVGVYGYLCLFLNVVFFSSLLAAAPSSFEALAREDSWVESLTAAWFLLAGILLFVTAWLERSFLQRCAYVLGGMAMVFVAGRRNQLGSARLRVCDARFPDALECAARIHGPQYRQWLFDLIYLNGTLILCMVTSAAFFCRKDRLFGFPLPSILLMLGFLVILSYETGVNFRGLIGENFREYVMDIRRSFGLIVIEEKVLLLLFFIFTLVSGQIKMIIASGATLALVLAFTYVNFHGDASTGSLYEVREYLFGICCLFYSVELLMTQRWLTTVSRKSGSSGTTGRTPLDPIAAPPATAAADGASA